MPETAKGYYSAFKVFLELKYGDVGIIPVFQKNIWAKFLSAMNTTKQRLHYKHNVKMSNPKAMISEKHREGIGKICIWNGTAESATFLAFNTSLFHHAARSVETAGLRKSEMEVMDDKCQIREMPTLGNVVSRSKIGRYHEKVRTYPHKEKLPLCYHFGLAYSLVLNAGRDGGNDFLFPAFAEKLNFNTNEDNANRSTETAASELFAKYADVFVKMAETYGDNVTIVDSDYEPDLDKEFVISIPRKFRAHSGKKGAVNELAEQLDIQYFAFRCGWLVKSFHSAFDYILNTEKKDGEYTF